LKKKKSVIQIFSKNFRVRRGRYRRKRGCPFSKVISIYSGSFGAFSGLTLHLHILSSGSAQGSSKIPPCYGEKATQQKSKFTNILENLNSQMRDKISYLVRRTKAHSKSFDWLNFRLAMFFTNLNLKNKFAY
jgi:hypothetical protein